MKWGNSSDKAVERVERFMLKVLGPKGLYILLALAALVLLSGAGDKWG